MTMSAADVGSMVAAAEERLRSGWRPGGSFLSTLVASDQPPLTSGAVDMYLEFYAWLWGREVPADDDKQVRERLTQDSYTAWSRMDYSIRDAVLATCALWAEIAERPEPEQDEIRTFLQRGMKPGSYPEVQRRSEPADATAVGVDDYRKVMARRHNAVMAALQNWPDLPG